MNIKHDKVSSFKSIDVKTILHVEEQGDYYMVVSDGDEPDSPYGLLNLIDGEMAATNLKHPSHIINHVKRHFGEFKIITEDEYTLDIHA